jgi:hypothetical protein
LVSQRLPSWMTEVSPSRCRVESGEALERKA